jgi:putative membrane protein
VNVSAKSQEESEPDYRFSLANERTFLAWMRTALALLAAAVLFHQFAIRLQPRWLPSALAAGVCVLAAVIAAAGFLQWRSNQVAMRHGQPLPPSRLLAGLAIGMMFLSAGTAAILLRQ